MLQTRNENFSHLRDIVKQSELSQYYSLVKVILELYANNTRGIDSSVEYSVYWEKSVWKRCATDPSFVKNVICV